MRMRTLPEAARLLKEEDPGTAITLTGLRRMVKQGRIPVSMQGKNKPLIDMDRLPEYLFAQAPPEVPTPDSGPIHAIPE